MECFFAGFLLALMGGFAYTWGVFTVPMVERLGWTTPEAVLPFTAFMGIGTSVMVLAGRLRNNE